MLRTPRDPGNRGDASAPFWSLIVQREEPTASRLFLDIVAQIKGADGVAALVRAFGGSEIFVPRNMSRSENFQGAFGEEDAYVISYLFYSLLKDAGPKKSRCFYIALGSNSTTNKRRARALVLLREGMSKSEAALRSGFTVRALFRHIERHGLEQPLDGLDAAERTPRVGEADIEQARAAYHAHVARLAARVPTREQIRRQRRRAIRKAIRLGTPRKRIVADLGISSSTMSAYLNGLRKTGLVIDFGRGPEAGTKLDGSAWQQRKTKLRRAYDDGLTRDEMAEQLGMNRLKLSRELRRLARDEGRPFPLPWKCGPRPRATAA